MNKPEITIDVLIDASYSVESGENSANMVTFHGSLDCDAFHGEIMPGAVDTQKKSGETLTLSARYMLKGKDRNGNNVSLFIENNGTVILHQPLVTTPKILTDCEELKYLESIELNGTIEPLSQNHIAIHIYRA